MLFRSNPESFITRVRVTVAGRSESTNLQGATLGVFAADDTHLRRAFTTTMSLRNQLTQAEQKALDKEFGLRGNLNAAHASPTAMAHAAPHSMVGLVADYKAAVMDFVNGTDDSKNHDPIGTMSAAIAALETFSNKDVDVDVVNAVNDILGQKDEDFDDSQISDDVSPPED